MRTDPADVALYLAQSVVDQPSLVRVTKRGATLVIHVAPGEEGRVIGRSGRVIQAIRTVVRAVSDPRERLTVDLDSPRGER